MIEKRVVDRSFPCSSFARARRSFGGLGARHSPSLGGGRRVRSEVILGRQRETIALVEEFHLDLGVELLEPPPTFVFLRVTSRWLRVVTSMKQP